MKTVAAKRLNANIPEHVAAAGIINSRLEKEFPEFYAKCANFVLTIHRNSESHIIGYVVHLHAQSTQGNDLGIEFATLELGPDLVNDQLKPVAKLAAVA